ncbi:MAG: hypothetical protein WB777_14360, partial [Mycobacterium sp.]
AHPGRRASDIAWQFDEYASQRLPRPQFLLNKQSSPARVRYRSRPSSKLSATHEGGGQMFLRSLLSAEFPVT